MKDKVLINYIWAMVVLAIVFLIMLGLIIIFSTPYNIHFSMDNNTLEAIKLMNWTAIENVGRT